MNVFVCVHTCVYLCMHVCAYVCVSELCVLGHVCMCLCICYEFVNACVFV